MFKLICIAFFVGLAIVPSYASPKPKSDLTCELCTLVLQGAENLISKNETDDKIISFIEKNLCGRLGSLNGTCVNFMESEGRQILYELAQGIHPSIICHRIGLCNARAQKPLVQPKLRSSAASLNCTVCKLVMTQVKNMLNNNASETQILNFIEDHLCNLTGAFSTLCKTVITSFGPQILKLLANDVDPTAVCVLIGMCSNSSLSTTGTKPHSLFCEFTTSVLIEHLNGEFMMNQVESVINHACNIHGTSNSCTSFVNTFVPTGLQLVSQQISPNKLCETYQVEEAQVNNPIVCELCTVVLTAAQSYIAKNESEEKVLAFIEKELCGRLGSLNATCVNFLETEGKQILNDLASGLNASVVCKKFGLCAAPRPVKVQVNPIECTICQYAVQFVDSELKGNKTETAVVDALEKVCKIIPESLRTQCNSLISTYGVYLVQLIIEFADPLKVCQAIKVC